MAGFVHFRVQSQKRDLLYILQMSPPSENGLDASTGIGVSSSITSVEKFLLTVYCGGGVHFVYQQWRPCVSEKG